MPKKWENVRVVTFQEDYKSKAGKVLFRKGRTVAMHNRTIQKLIARGAKATVLPFDREKAVAKAKRELAEAEEAQTKAMYR
jgi:hypothetical protein